MKKMKPYLLSLIIGSIFGMLVFKSGTGSKLVFGSSIDATGFQLGVFNSLDLAQSYKNKYPSSIILSDGDVYRVYYSILTNDSVIKSMEKFLNEEKIAFYKKNIIISDSGLIDGINTYEESMIDVSSKALESINKLMMDSYGGSV